MKKIIVASKNPVKIQASLNGFRRMFPADKFSAQGVSVDSGVQSQPMTDAETLTGATNRANFAKKAFPEMDYWVGIEGGVEVLGNEIAAFAWIVVLAENQIGKSRSGLFFLPKPVADLIHAGEELGTADDIIFGRKNSKQSGGAVGILTNNVIDRIQLYEHAMILALAPFKNRELYRQTFSGFSP